MTAVANALVVVLGVYVALGVIFAVPFVLRGVHRIDPVSRESSWGFRLIVLPGVVALWPLLARRWASGKPPPVERNPHRDAAGRPAS